MRCGLQAERALIDFFDLREAVQPLAIGRVAHAAVAVRFGEGDARPRIEHGALGREQGSMQRSLAEPDSAATQCGRCGVVRAEPQPLEQQRFGRHGERARRRRNAHASQPSESHSAARAGVETGDSVGRFMAGGLYRPTRGAPRASGRYSPK